MDQQCLHARADSDHSLECVVGGAHGRAHPDRYQPAAVCRRLGDGRPGWFHRSVDSLARLAGARRRLTDSGGASHGLPTLSRGRAQPIDSAGDVGGVAGASAVPGVGWGDCRQPVLALDFLRQPASGASDAAAGAAVDKTRCAFNRAPAPGPGQSVQTSRQPDAARGNAGLPVYSGGIYRHQPDRHPLRAWPGV